MGWSIQQVAKMSGVTARTLRHYDDIGLLTPARFATNGYRYYERPQILRLQQILLLRELGLDLATIGAVIDAEHDPVDALRRHHRRLLDERGRLDRLAATVEATIAHLEKGTDMPPEKLFKGFEFSHEYVAGVEASEVERTGNAEQPELAEVKRNIADWTEDDFSEFNQQGAQLERRMLSLLRDGAAVDDPATFAVLDEDLALQRQLWTPQKDSYVALAESLVEPSEWRTHLDTLDPALAGYLRDAMVAYAHARL